MGWNPHCRNTQRQNELIEARRRANLATMAEAAQSAARGLAEERGKLAAGAAITARLQRRAGRYDPYGAPIVWIDGKSTNMNADQYAVFLADQAERAASERARSRSWSRGR